VAGRRNNLCRIKAGAPLRDSGRMRETGVSSTGNCGIGNVPAPPGVFMVAPPEVPRNASRPQSEGRAKRGSTATGIIEAGTPSKARPARRLGRASWRGRAASHPRSRVRIYPCRRPARGRSAGRTL
jgi:hypothetical protein